LIERECGSKNFIPDRSAALTTDWQKIRVQVCFFFFITLKPRVE